MTVESRSMVVTRRGFGILAEPTRDPLLRKHGNVLSPETVQASNRSPQESGHP